MSLSLVLRVLFQSILLLVLVCGFVRVPSLADVCVGFPPSVLASLHVVFVGRGISFSPCVKESCFWRRLMTRSDLGFSLATWSASGTSQGFAWVFVSFGSKDFP